MKSLNSLSANKQLVHLGHCKEENHDLGYCKIITVEVGKQMYVQKSEFSEPIQKFKSVEFPAGCNYYLIYPFSGIITHVLAIQ